MWSACVLGKVKIYVWLACLDSLPTWLNLCKRRMTNEEVCVVCGGQIESTEHVLRECNVARAVWFRSLGIRVDMSKNVFYALLANINIQVPTSGFELCLMLIWALWKHMNEVLWNDTSLPPHEIMLRTEGWMQKFQKWHKATPKKFI